MGNGELSLYVESEEGIKHLRVPVYIVKDLLRDRLSTSEVARIHRLADAVEKPELFKAGSVVVNFSTKTAQCFASGLKLEDLEPTWDVNVKKVEELLNIS